MMNDKLFDELNKNTINNIIGTSKAVLYIFTPRVVDDMYVRPYVYRFNEKTKSIVTEGIFKGDTNLIDQATNICATEIIPKPNGIPVYTSLFSDKYTFLLIVENIQNEKIKLINANFIIYFGYFTDVPYSLNTGHTPVFNENARMVIMKKILVNKLPYSIHDPNKHIYQVVADSFDINNKSVYPTQDITDIRIGSLMDKSLTNDSINYIHTPDQYRISENAFSTDDPNPYYNAKILLTGIKNATLGLLSTGETQYYLDSGFQIEEIVSKTIDDTVRSSIVKNNTVAFEAGLQIDAGLAQYSLQDIINMYNPEIRIINVNQVQQLDIVPQEYQMLNTIYGTLLNHILPGMIESCGLSSIAFLYDSFKDNLQIWQASTLFAETPDIQERRISKFIYIFNTQLVPYLKHQGGDFVLTAFVNLSGQNYISLQYLDFDPIHGFIRSDNLFSNFAIPVIGDTDTAIENTAVVSNLVTDITKTVQNTVI